MTDEQRAKTKRLMRASIRGEGLDAEDMRYIDRMYKAWPAEYGELHKEVREQEHAAINPLSRVAKADQPKDVEARG